MSTINTLLNLFIQMIGLLGKDGTLLLAVLVLLGMIVPLGFSHFQRKELHKVYELAIREKNLEIERLEKQNKLLLDTLLHHSPGSGSSAREGGRSNTRK